ncbi:MAG: isoprenylcysteine carboxylmethyltransferase family protein [Acidobacteriota bacterium]
MPNAPSPRRIIPPPLLLVACLLTGAGLQYVRPWPLAPYSFLVGMSAGGLLLVLSGLFGLRALLLMRKHRTPVEPWKSPLHLVTEGPFRWTRNPLYLTMCTFMTALALMVNSAWVLGSALLLAVLLDRLVISREEKILQAIFGSAYTAYKGRVRRWL